MGWKKRLIEEVEGWRSASLKKAPAWNLPLPRGPTADARPTSSTIASLRPRRVLEDDKAVFSLFEIPLILDYVKRYFPVEILLRTRPSFC